MAFWPQIRITYWAPASADVPSPSSASSSPPPLAPSFHSSGLVTGLDGLDSGGSEFSSESADADFGGACFAWAAACSFSSSWRSFAHLFPLSLCDSLGFGGAGFSGGCSSAGGSALLVGGGGAESALLVGGGGAESALLVGGRNQHCWEVGVKQAVRQGLSLEGQVAPEFQNRPWKSAQGSNFP